jgi:diadenosine tetraphosphate (Ap4A) HIT family hydrolase
MNEKSRTVVQAARTEDQKEAMERIQARGTCPFCAKELAREHHKPILRSGPYWTVTTSQWPYKGTEQHFLIIYAPKHIEFLSEVSPEAWEELRVVEAWLEETYRIESGALCIRFGKIPWNGASVSHLHAHLIVPPLKPIPEKIRFSIGYHKKT